LKESLSKVPHSPADEFLFPSLTLGILSLLDAILPAYSDLEESLAQIPSSSPCIFEIGSSGCYYREFAFPLYKYSLSCVFDEHTVIDFSKLTADFSLLLRPLGCECGKVLKSKDAASYLVEKGSVRGACIPAKEGLGGKFTFQVYLREVKEAVNTDAGLISATGT